MSGYKLSTGATILAPYFRKEKAREREKKITYRTENATNLIFVKCSEDLLCLIKVFYARCVWALFLLFLSIDCVCFFFCTTICSMHSDVSIQLHECKTVLRFVNRLWNISDNGMPDGCILKRIIRLQKHVTNHKTITTKYYNQRKTDMNQIDEWTKEMKQTQERSVLFWNGKRQAHIFIIKSSKKKIRMKILKLYEIWSLCEWPLGSVYIFIFW